MKKYNKQRLFEVMEKVNPDFQLSNDNTWAIFRISHGEKCFITALSGGDNKLFSECHYQVKYSDPKVLKFSLENAKELVERNKSLYVRYGLVNDKGLQLVQGKYDGLWQRGSLSEDENKSILPKFIIPIGISGSGKSRWIKSLEGQGYVVISPDEIRKELTGSISDQSRNKDVFPIAFSRAVKALNRGENVIFDATNVVSKLRVSMLEFLKKNVPNGFEAYAKVFDADPEISKERIRKDIENGVDRSDVPPEAIDRQHGNYLKDLDKIESDGYTLMQ